MRLLGYSGWLLRCCYVVARVPGWLLGCCYVVAKVMLGGCYGTRGGCLGVAMWLLGYLGWLLGCCYAVARVPRWLLGCCYAVAKLPGVVAKVLLCGC